MAQYANPGLGLQSGDLINQLVYAIVGGMDNITAHAGGGQASATQITAGLNRVTVCATTNDSVRLPSAVANPNPPGIADISIHNAGAQTLAVYPYGSTDQINELGAATSIAIAAGKSANFFCASTGNWSATVSA